MIWQDAVVMSMCFGLGAAAVPSIFSKHKPNKPLCLMYSIIILVLAFSFGSLSLWLSTSGEIFAALPWIVMFFQRR